MEQTAAQTAQRTVYTDEALNVTWTLYSTSLVMLMQLGFSLSPSDFDATMRQACARSVAATADVNATQVRITSVDVAPSAAQRRLLATRITVGVAIAEPLL